MAAPVIPAGIAAAVPKEARHRLDRAALQALAQNVPRRCTTVPAAVAVAVPGHADLHPTPLQLRVARSFALANPTVAARPGSVAIPHSSNEVLTINR